MDRTVRRLRPIADDMVNFCRSGFTLAHIWVAQPKGCHLCRQNTRPRYEFVDGERYLHARRMDLLILDAG